MSKFFQGDSDGYGLLAIVEQGSDFCFSSRGHYVAENVARGMYRTIKRRLGSRRFVWVNWGVAQKEMTTSSASCFGGGEIGTVTVDV